MEKQRLRWMLVAAVGGLGGGCEIIAGLGDPVLDNMALCSDGIKDGNETSKDCGGGCAGCPAGEACQVGADCASKLCGGGTCLAPACDDKVKNGDESDIDCGGTCPLCGPDKTCGSDGDCKGANCEGARCAPTCTDGVKSGDETGLDCGGSCSPCPNGDGCAVGRDCQSGVCEAGSCKDFYVWAKRFGPLDTMSSAGAPNVAVDSAGGILLAGGFETNFSFGPGTQPLMATEGIFIAKFNPFGDLLWSAAAKGTLPVDVRSIAVDGANDTVMVAEFLGELTVDATKHTSAGYSDIFVAKAYGAVGAFKWSARFGGSDVEHAWGVVVDAADDIILTGSFQSGTIDFGGGALSSANGQTFLVKLNPSGGHVWSKNFNAGDGARIASDSMGNVVLSGRFVGAANFGAGPLTSMGGMDVFVTKFTSSGTCLWSKRSGDAQDQYADYIAVDKNGNILVAGQFAGTLDWGGGKLTTLGHAAFLVKLDPSGNYIWGKTFDQAGGSSFVNQIAIDTSGKLSMTGQLSGTVDFGGGPLVSAGNDDVFIVKLDADGNYLWGRRFGDGQRQVGAGLAFSDAKNLVVTGFLEGSLDLGSGPLVSMSYQDIFLAKLLTP